MFTGFEIFGIVITIVLVSIMFGIVEYACKLGWLLLLPCRILSSCCNTMRYDDEEEDSFCFGTHYVV